MNAIVKPVVSVSIFISLVTFFRDTHNWLFDFVRSKEIERQFMKYLF